MKRRNFIEVGAMTGAAGVVMPAALSSLSQPDEASRKAIEALPDMEAYLAKIDKVVNDISAFDLAQHFNVGDKDMNHENRLAQTALKTLFLTVRFSDLPEEGQRHPGMQERIKNAMPEMDEAIFGTIDYLEGLKATEKAEIQLLLSHKSNPGMLIAEKLDEAAVRQGLSRRRRLQLRSMTTNIVGRLRHQPADVLIDEYAGKVRRLTAREGSAVRPGRKLASKASQKVFWETLPDADKGAPPNDGPSKGAITMGMGLVLAGIGGIVIASGSDAGYFIVTVGGIVLIVGLIMLIASAILREIKNSRANARKVKGKSVDGL